MDADESANAQKTQTLFSQIEI